MGPQIPIGRHMSNFKAKPLVTFTKHQYKGNISQFYLLHFKEKTSFWLSLDKMVCVQVSLDKKGYVTCPFHNTDSYYLKPFQLWKIFHLPLLLKFLKGPYHELWILWQFV